MADKTDVRAMTSVVSLLGRVGVFCCRVCWSGVFYRDDLK